LGTVTFIEILFGMPPLMPLMPLAWMVADASKATAHAIDIALFIAFLYESLPAHDPTLLAAVSRVSNWRNGDLGGCGGLWPLFPVFPELSLSISPTNPRFSSLVSLAGLLAGVILAVRGAKKTPQLSLRGFGIASWRSPRGDRGDLLRVAFRAKKNPASFEAGF
jgi:hypothetical protein